MHTVHKQIRVMRPVECAYLIGLLTSGRRVDRCQRRGRHPDRGNLRVLANSTIVKLWL